MSLDSLYIFYSFFVEPLCVHWFACASMWIFLFCSAVPGRSHTVTIGALTLPVPVHKKLHAPQRVMPCFLPSLQTREFQSQWIHSQRKRKRTKHLAHHGTPTPPHDSLGTMKPSGLEGRTMRGRMLPPHPSCEFQLLALRCCWHCLICIRARY